ncbi:MAG: hypothetical protein SGJ26_16950, partial [Nitrospirota bacterium]|nr:hypothetical protein [Nitrospirota bacterium]
ESGVHTALPLNCRRSPPMTDHVCDCSSNLWSAPRATPSRMAYSAVLDSRAGHIPVIEIGMTTSANTKRVGQEADTTSRPRLSDVTRT